MKPTRKIHHGLRGRVKCAVVENGEVVREYDWQDNLILDQGLDFLATTLYNQLFIACAAGTGTQTTGRNTGASATVSGTTVTSTTPAFLNTDLDADIVFSTGEVGKIQSYISPTQVTLFSSLTIGTATPFTVLFVNQAALGSEVKRSSIYIVTPGGCGTTVTAAAISLFRTFIFTPESVAITYTEIGLSPDIGVGANLFSRILLGTPITVLGPSADVPDGQQLQVTYELQVMFDYGSGPGDYFTGVNDTTINITNLPISYGIFNYATSATFPGKLAVSIPVQIAFNIGSNLTIAGSSLPGYNNTYSVLGTQFIVDPTNGPSTIVTLSRNYLSSASGGTLTSDGDGIFFRACQGIFLIGASGQSLAPAPTDNIFAGYDEPSITGQAWISSATPALMGSNGVPAGINPNLVASAACTTLAYTVGTFYVDRAANVVVPDALALSISSFGFGAADTTNQIITYCFNQPQGLVAGGTLALTFRTSWGRVYATT